MADRRPLITLDGDLQELPDGDRITGHVISASFSQIVVLSQAAYDALDPPDPDTLYMTTEA